MTIKRRIGVPLLAALAVLGLLSKEQGITVLPLIMIYETLFGAQSKEVGWSAVDKTADKPLDKGGKAVATRIRLKLSAQFGNYQSLARAMLNSSYNGKLFTLLIAILFVRCRLLHDLPRFSRFDNPIDSLPSPFKQLNYLYIWLFNLHQFLYPYRLACDWSAESIQLITSASNLHTVLIILILVVASSLIYIIHQTVLLNNFKFLFVSSSLYYKLFEQPLQTEITNH